MRERPRSDTRSGNLRWPRAWPTDYSRGDRAPPRDDRARIPELESATHTRTPENRGETKPAYHGRRKHSADEFRLRRHIRPSGSECPRFFLIRMRALVNVLPNLACFAIRYRNASTCPTILTVRVPAV